MLAKIGKILIPLLVLALLSAMSVWYWHHNAEYPSTDDAYVKAHVINVAPQVDGNVVDVKIQNHQLVTQGQLLFTIDNSPYQIELSKAQAQLDSTKDQIAAAEMAVDSAKAIVQEKQANLVDIRADTKRILSLVKQNFESKSDGDLAVKNLHVAEADLLAAQAQLKQAEQNRGVLGDNNAQLRAAETAIAAAKLNLGYTQVFAPCSGYIDNFDLQKGDKVNAYQPVFAIIENNTWWVDANFKETQLARITPGQNVEISLDMYPGKTFNGKVLSISDGSGTSFSLLPPENASGNWVKVTQRFPVKIILSAEDQQFPYRLDASATATVDTTTAVIPAKAGS